MTYEKVNHQNIFQLLRSFIELYIITSILLSAIDLFSKKSYHIPWSKISHKYGWIYWMIFSPNHQLKWWWWYLFRWNRAVYYWCMHRTNWNCFFVEKQSKPILFNILKNWLRFYCCSGFFIKITFGHNGVEISKKSQNFVAKLSARTEAIDNKFVHVSVFDAIIHGLLCGRQQFQMILIYVDLNHLGSGALHGLAIARCILVVCTEI